LAHLLSGPFWAESWLRYTLLPKRDCVLHPMPNGDSGPSCFISVSSHLHGSRTSCSASFHPWKSCHMTTRSRDSTCVTPWPLWQGLVIVVVVPTYATPCLNVRRVWHRLSRRRHCIVTPPTRWTGLCSAPAITPYCPWQQPVWLAGPRV
jgi:hypothetical protein